METAALQKEPKTPLKNKNTSFFKPAVQKKLSVGSADDSYETEADRAADKVMKMPEPTPQVTHTGALLQRKCADCGEDELQMKPLAENITPLIQRSSSESGGVAPHHVESGINSGRGSGSSMDTGTKSFMESRFGTDFSHVKIHTGSEAVQMSRELSAQAFTVGNDIYFNEGKYSPGSDHGKHLLAHELTHTIQQNGTIGRKIQRAFNPGRCCNESVTGNDEWALVSTSNASDPTVWQRLPVGNCVGNFYDTDCEGMTCGGGFYTVQGWTTLVAPGTCRTPGEDDYFYEDNRWTPSDQTRADAHSPTARGSDEGDVPPNYVYTQ
ncbi:hypothetical protein HNP38_000095 [Chryseobacterium defluvii]|uniref:eCIS core domain-containing protein n=1 Tax=Chryseobacterium defluvii TaxID=160396 RepID=A0A840KBA9_9FLAO|nr:DUF4157 domain-containing protein [Chryseobacterium defluvii]MBB4804823.1 hypothetical protein [Chryseobacterium defluvii]